MVVLIQMKKQIILSFYIHVQQLTHTDQHNRWAKNVYSINQAYMKPMWITVVNIHVEFSGFCITKFKKAKISSLLLYISK